jgi:hypothetical protein
VVQEVVHCVVVLLLVVLLTPNIVVQEVLVNFEVPRWALPLVSQDVVKFAEVVRSAVKAEDQEVTHDVVKVVVLCVVLVHVVVHEVVIGVL